MPRQGARDPARGWQRFPAGARTPGRWRSRPSRTEQAAPFDGFRGQQRMIQATQAQADDQNHVQYASAPQDPRSRGSHRAARASRRRLRRSGRRSAGRKRSWARSSTSKSMAMPASSRGDMRRDRRHEGDRDSPPNSGRARSSLPSARAHPHCAGHSESARIPRPPASSRRRVFRGRPRRGIARMRPEFWEHTGPPGMRLLPGSALRKSDNGIFQM